MSGSFGGPERLVLQTALVLWTHTFFGNLPLGYRGNMHGASPMYLGNPL